MAFRGHYVLPRLDDLIMDIRINTIYKNMLHGEYNRAIKVMKNTIFQIQNTRQVEDISMKDLRRIHNKLYGAIINLAMNRYEDAHNQIRDCHYLIATS